MTVVLVALLIIIIAALVLAALWWARRLELIGVPAGRRARRVAHSANKPPTTDFAGDLTVVGKMPLRSDRRMLPPNARRALLR